jgi:hypothetical protein
MGIAEIITNSRLRITAHIILYGQAADAAIAASMQEEIETMWNEPQAIILIQHHPLALEFRITAEVNPGLTDLEVYQNLDPRNNYFRVEEYVHGNISFVDAIGSNSGYFKLENLYKGSTTAAHEFGHTIGLEHPDNPDIRGEGVPGIMYPRGTLVDPAFQYDSNKPAGMTGGTMHPMFRKVRLEDIEHLKLHHLDFHNNQAVVGDFTNIYHEAHIPGAV